MSSLSNFNGSLSFELARLATSSNLTQLTNLITGKGIAHKFRTNSIAVAAQVVLGESSCLCNTITACSARDPTRWAERGITHILEV